LWNNPIWIGGEEMIELVKKMKEAYLCTTEMNIMVSKLYNMIDVSIYNSKLEQSAKILAKVQKSTVEEAMEFMTGSCNVIDALVAEKKKVMRDLVITEQELSELIVQENQQFFGRLMNLFDEELPWIFEHDNTEGLSEEQQKLLSEYELLMECSDIDGYSLLTKDQRRCFLMTYKRHQKCIGQNYKDKWKAKSVHDIGNSISVTFNNGEWLHYLPDGTWG